jgi:AcrR family transcriptional regulator
VPSNRSSSRNRKAPAQDSRSYHHGRLRQALIAAAEAILAEEGLEALSLRAAARRAGVSPAAPAHHFASLKGLLTEVAILGFEALTEELEKGNARGGADPVARLREQGIGYVRFALSYPGRFLLMFRRERLNQDEPHLKEAGQRAFALLEGAVRAIREIAPEQPLDPSARALLLLAWSTVHGFAHLALEGQLDPMAGVLSLEHFVATNLPQVLERMLHPH